MIRYRIYADGTIVHENNFDKYDQSLPYADYSEHGVPEGNEDVKYWDIPEMLKQHIIGECHV